MLSLPQIPFFALPAALSAAPGPPAAHQGTNPSSLPYCTAPSPFLPSPAQCITTHTCTHTHTRAYDCHPLSIRAGAAASFASPTTQRPCPPPPCNVEMPHDTQLPLFAGTRASPPPRLPCALCRARLSPSLPSSTANAASAGLMRVAAPAPLARTPSSIPSISPLARTSLILLTLLELTRLTPRALAAQALPAWAAWAHMLATNEARLSCGSDPDPCPPFFHYVI